MPLDAEETPHSWKACILVRDGGPGVSELVLLVNLPDARAYLGCVLDDRNMVRVWLQIWVQNLDGFVALDARFAEQLSSESMDERWQRHWQAIRDTNAASIALEIPEDKLRPLYLDVRRWMVLRPSTPQGSEWVLCKDNQLLRQARLPEYSQSLWRYLRTTPPAATERFVAADSSAPLGETAAAQSAELGFDPAWLPINPQGGRLAARVHPLLDFGDYVDLLNGATIADLSARKRSCEADILRSELTAVGGDGRRHGLLLGNDGIELFYLKLRLLLQAGKALLSHLRQSQCPLLNLDPASFGVYVGASGDLPWPWTTTCDLVRPGQAYPLAIPETSEVRFAPAGQANTNAYCPAGLSKRGDQSVSVRPMRIVTDEQHRTSMEGTLWISSPVPVEVSDVVRFRLSQGWTAGDFFGAVVGNGAGLRQEIQFRTWPRTLELGDAAQLKRHEGGRIERCWCELIPAVSSPYDLHSLAVLGARALLTHDKNPLATVVDALERLGRLVGAGFSSSASHADTVREVEKLLVEAALPDSLMAHHVYGNLPDGAKNPNFLPASLWAEALAILIRLLPGLGPVSQCPDYGAAPAGALHLPLEEPLAALESLGARARSLIFSDWNSNREMRTILAGLRNSL